MKPYFRRLKTHPGIPVATLLTILAGWTGAFNESLIWWQGALVGASIMGILTWGTVLILNIKR